MKSLIESIQLDFRSGAPIYSQIVEQVKQQIVRGELKPGDQLPTVRALAVALQVNFNTVARAYRLLDEDQIISTQQGRGTFILDLPPPKQAGKIKQQALEALTRDFLSAAQRLGFSRTEIGKILRKQFEKQERHD